MTSSIKIYVLLTLVGCSPCAVNGGLRIQYKTFATVSRNRTQGLCLKTSNDCNFGTAVVCPGNNGPGAGGHSLMCRACDRVTSPYECTVIEKCRGYCGTDVWRENGQQFFSFRCKDDHECFHHVPSPTSEHPCNDCCDITGCELNSCAAFHPTVAPAPTTPAPATTTPAPTTTTPAPTTTTPAPTTTTPVPTTQANLCRNIETNGFQCSDMDPFHFCSDTSGLAHMLAFEKCPLHCGICRIGEAMPTHPPTSTLPPATATSSSTTIALLGRRSPLSYNLRKRKLN